MSSKQASLVINHVVGKAERVAAGTALPMVVFGNGYSYRVCKLWQISKDPEEPPRLDVGDWSRRKININQANQNIFYCFASLVSFFLFPNHDVCLIDSTRYSQRSEIVESL